MQPPSRRPVYFNQFVDVSSVRAVGFDLDHTVAVYHDDAVNRLACEEAARFLVHHLGYDERVLETSYDGSRVARGLGFESGTGAIVKIDGQRRVRRAFRDGRWCGADELERAFPSPLDTAGTHMLHSLFDLPTGWLLMTCSELSTGGTPAREPDECCREVRLMLDRSHTSGDLKHSILDNIGRFVQKLNDPGVFQRMRESDRKMFVLTNSSYDYAVALLDYIFDGSATDDWRDLFDVVVVSANKPDFFAGSLVPRLERSSGSSRVIDGGSALALESCLGVAARDVIYAGDHAEYDVASAARHGWQTVHVVSELDAQPALAYWGSIFDEDGSPTWFSRLVGNAHLFTSSVESFVAQFGNGAFVPGADILKKLDAP